MYHTLKTLYEHSKKHNSELFKYLKYLKDYCYDADEFHHGINLNMKYNSLKWFIYTLRDNISSKEVEEAFYFAVAESQNDEMKLYNNISSLKIFFKYREFFKNNLDLSKHEIRQLHEWRVLINRTTENITAITFKRRVADIIIFRNPENFATGLVFNEKDTDVLKSFTLPHIFVGLQKLDPGGWQMIGRNLIIKGGPKAVDKSDNQSLVTEYQVFEILKKNYIKIK